MSSDFGGSVNILIALSVRQKSGLYLLIAISLGISTKLNTNNLYKTKCRVEEPWPYVKGQCYT
jgi:hypothetical protein